MFLKFAEFLKFNLTNIRVPKTSEGAFYAKKSFPLTENLKKLKLWLFLIIYFERKSHTTNKTEQRTFYVLETYCTNGKHAKSERGIYGNIKKFPKSRSDGTVAMGRQYQ